MGSVYHPRLPQVIISSVVVLEAQSSGSCAYFTGVSLNLFQRVLHHLDSPQTIVLRPFPMHVSVDCVRMRRDAAGHIDKSAGLFHIPSVYPRRCVDGLPRTSSCARNRNSDVHF